MPSFDGVRDLARYFQERFEVMTVEAKAAPAELARETAPVMLAQTRGVIGLTPPLAPLAPSTQAERVREGYSANDPLLRSGELRDTYGDAAIDNTAITGSDDPRASWHEHGYFNVRAQVSVPPRPVLGLALDAAGRGAQRLMVAMARVIIEE